jgi:hypothetical protein
VDPLLSDPWLSVHTLVREDIVAGVRNNNMERLAKAEQTATIQDGWRVASRR